VLPELSGLLVVLGFPHQEHGEEVGAYLQIDSLAERLKAKLASAILAMPVAERPKVVLHGPQPIPRTHTGKIQRRKMQPWFASWAAYRGPLVVQAQIAVEPKAQG
jgi:acyl-coenzyme A synthetase/AMP-(fatty) acid ligase